MQVANSAFLFCLKAPVVGTSGVGSVIKRGLRDI